MKRFLKLVILVPAAAVLVVFALANRHFVAVSMDPFDPTSPVLSFRLPLFVLLFLVLAIGIVIGGTAAWLRQGRWRRLARRTAAEVGRLRRGGNTLPPPPPIGQSLTTR
ncbi:MAG: DUF1049 domain-containing protein [Bauldia sp.]